MTCIVALGHSPAEVVTMGADSAASCSRYTRATMEPSKIIGFGKTLIGYAGSFRMGQILEMELFNNKGFPAYKNQSNPYKYLLTEFMPAVRQAMKDGGYTEVVNNREESGHFIVGIRGRIFEINVDSAVIRYAQGFHAIGSGDVAALASISTALKKGDFGELANRTDICEESIKIVRTALEVAAELVPTVQEPFRVVQVTG